MEYCIDKIPCRKAAAAAFLYGINIPACFRQFEAGRIHSGLFICRKQLPFSPDHMEIPVGTAVSVKQYLLRQHSPQHSSARA